jgi:hypothetical protein
MAGLTGDEKAESYLLSSMLLHELLAACTCGFMTGNCRK